MSLASFSLKFLSGTLGTGSLGGQQGNNPWSSLIRMACWISFPIISLPGYGALTSQECGSVVSGRVTNSSQVIQDFPSFSTESLKFLETRQSRSNWDGWVPRLVPNSKECSLAVLLLPRPPKWWFSTHSSFGPSFFL